MKTADEKFDEFLSKNGGNSLGSPINAAYEGFLAGYNEAMRWRDVEEELPEDGVLVQVKYRDLFNEKNVNYEHNVYYAVHEIWDIEQCGCIKVTHWRPFE